MPKQAQRVEFNNFVAGLITEASPLNFPQNASADELNFELNRDGSRSRRLGMDLENSYAYLPTIGAVSDGNELGYNTFRWEAVGGDPTLSIVVVQVNQTLIFYNLNNASISGPGPMGTQGLTLFPQNTRYSFAALEGYLVVVGGAEEFAIITYNAGSFSLEYQRILVRDVWGIQEQGDPLYETDPSYRAGLDSFHRYNLQNQSWGIPRKAENGILVDPAQEYFGGTGGFGIAPSNSEQVWVGLQTQAVAQNQTPFERMYLNMYQDSYGGTTKSAKGYFIIDALRRGSSRVDAVTANKQKYHVFDPVVVTPPPDYTPGGPTAIAEFAGRVFFSGFQGTVINGDKRSPNYSNYVFFSQLVKSRQEFARCYQEGDPTSRDTADLVDTDGGFVRVAGAERIIGMVNLQTQLVVIATNGVWTITGGTTDSGFTATNYKVVKISTFGGISQSSIVSEGDACFFWSDDGIYAVTRNQYGDLVCDSLSLTTIQSLYQAIPNSGKASAFGEYDQISKKIRWMYRTQNLFDVNDEQFEIVFDSQLKGFSQNKISRLNNRVEIGGVFRSSNFTVGSVDNEVFAGTDAVQVGADNVFVNSVASVSAIQSLRYLALVPIGGTIFITFAYYKENTFKDWFSIDGVGEDAKAYCLTGTTTFGDSTVDKQTPYLMMHFERTEEGVDSDFQPQHQSSCLMRSQWDFSNTINSNKWSSLTQAYRYVKPRLVESLLDNYDTGFAVISTKNKLRGRGKSFALYFETEAEKDCRILGWSLTVNANQIS